MLDKLSYMRKWHKEHKEHEKEYRLKVYPSRKLQMIQWGKDNPAKVKRSRDKYKKNHKWVAAFWSAFNHCHLDKNHSYYKRGIKVLMSVDDFKYLWFRDKANLMKQPSIDRIDGRGNYEINNCRYMELYDNQHRRKTYVCRAIGRDAP
jgi:hypothetical protein